MNNESVDFRLVRVQQIDEAKNVIANGNMENLNRYTGKKTMIVSFYSKAVYYCSENKQVMVCFRQIIQFKFQHFNDF